jgi:Ni/Co efflux regulator RcnB
MKTVFLAAARGLALALGVSLAAGAALGQPPPWAKGKGAQKGEKGGGARHFAEQHRGAVHEYYVAEFNSGRCPPGLAKKRNGCMPPGLAKKWRMGQPLPREVVYYDLPPALVVRIGVPPPGHRYVRVASDILLIAIGTGIVVDAILDLGR